MKQYLAVPAMVLAFLALMDLAVAATLKLSGDHGALPSLQRYFDYGRSVPGKLDQWIENPDLPENLFDVAWIPDTIAQSERLFAAEDPAPGTLRGYGMSFLAQMMRAAAEQDPALRIDLHGGPAAPPNFAYALFLKDRPNRRSGDVAVLAILSSSLPGMAALSNRSWSFEQPAPTTYPVFWPDGKGGLRPVEPLVTSAAQERGLRHDPEAATAWQRQLAQEDAFYSQVSFGYSFLDQSPLLRLVRRSWAMQTIASREAGILNEEAGYPLTASLQTMVAEFARIAREDGQLPVVYLIQGRDPADADVLRMVQPVLDEQRIPYLATKDLADPRDPTNFGGDGHFKDSMNRIFAEAFRRLLPTIGWNPERTQEQDRRKAASIPEGRPLQ
ncbi:hypothetical protein [Paracoccus sediminis]|uniref:Uncharacterized protein n=1 Tax=Paracoccus sediminis TaxID=1214787 RepID=A0A238Y8E3_9RHOB|nr:hypothetical protein [Paracoccus sediminis]SNR66874.1 hypothetical protein SAMN06265378_11544 [Paracoccus sediminis]